MKTLIENLQNPTPSLLFIALILSMIICVVLYAGIKEIRLNPEQRKKTIAYTTISVLGAVIVGLCLFAF